MCIACDMRELNKLHAEASQTLVESLVEVTHDLIRFLTGVTPVLSDAHQAAARELLSRAERVMGGAQAAQSEAPPLDDRGALLESLRKAFPGAKIIVGSAEEVEAFVEQSLSGKKPN